VVRPWLKGHLSLLSFSLGTFPGLVRHVQEELGEGAPEKGDIELGDTLVRVQEEEQQEEAEEEEEAVRALLEGMGGVPEPWGAYAVLTRGARGVLLRHRAPSSSSSSPSPSPSRQRPAISLHALPAWALPAGLVPNSTGAGDTLVGATTAHLLAARKGKRVVDLSIESVLAALRFGMAGSYLSLHSQHAVSPDLSQAAVLDTLHRLQ